MDWKQNLAPTKGVCHRELLIRGPDGLTIKDCYTAEDCWNYLWVRILGRNDSLGRSNETTRAEIDARRKQLEAQAREPTPEETAFFCLNCSRLGVQVVLSAIDIYTMDEGVDEFNISYFVRCLRQGQVEVSRALFKLDHPEVDG